MDKRKTGEGALKGWTTRRKRYAERSAAVSRLVDVADEIGGICVHGVRLNPNSPDGKFVVGSLTLIQWRVRIMAAVKDVR